MCIVFAINAQEQYVKGTVHITSKKNIEAYILMDYSNPQKFQKNIKYVHGDVYQNFMYTGKIEVEDYITTSAKRIYGFSLLDGKTFKSVKFDKTDLPIANKKLTTFFLEQITDGKIELFKFYSHTDDAIKAPELSDALYRNMTGEKDALLNYINNNFLLIVRKGPEEAPKNVLSIDVMNFISDNALIKDLHERDHYNVKEILTQIKKDYFLSNLKIEAAFVKMIAEYNGGLKTIK